MKSRLGNEMMLAGALTAAPARPGARRPTPVATRTRRPVARARRRFPARAPVTASAGLPPVMVRRVGRPVAAPEGAGVKRVKMGLPPWIAGDDALPNAGAILR